MGSVTRLPSRGGALRWHPYLPSTTCPPPSTQPYPLKPSPPVHISQRQSHLNTPVSTLVTTCSSFRNNLNQPSQSSSQIYTNRKDRQEVKKAQKEKFQNALKELAVRRLSDIWKETYYVTHSTRPTLANFPDLEICQPMKPPSIQLPSPYTPTTQTFQSPEQPKVQYTAELSSPRRIPLRAFVHEILRRSKTAWPALQIALCYLDAVKSKVPNAIAEAKLGQGLQAAEAVLDSLFDPAQLGDITETSRKTDAAVVDCLTPETQISSPSSVSGNARRLSNTGGDDDFAHRPCATQPPGIATTDQGADMVSRSNKRRRMPCAPSTPLPPRPSPLLCPRRMFIAALILATKFTQDRVYSNRAWAKICGLDAREVSRCERALGEALEWRLWVGKGMADEPTQFLRNFLLAEESLTATKKNQHQIASCSSTQLTRSLSESAVLIGNSSCSDNMSADLRSAFKQSSSLASIEFVKPRPAASLSSPMLNDPATLILTPVNADLDAMESECSSVINNHNTPSLVDSTGTSFISSLSDTTPFTTDEYSFNPKIPNSLPSPPFSHYSPYHHLLRASARSDQEEEALITLTPSELSLSKRSSSAGVIRPLGFDPVRGYTFGLEGTLATGIDDIEVHF